jgi:hypothetical protein
MDLFSPQMPGYEIVYRKCIESTSHAAEELMLAMMAAYCAL